MAKNHETADKNRHAEGPAGYNGGNGPGNATSLPIKKYPESSKGIPKKGDHNIIEGPCTDKPGY